VVSHGIEQILKERLRRVHPSLIWDDVDKFPSLSARTVTVDIAISRLIKIGGLDYLQEEVDLIRAIRDTRNAICQQLLFSSNSYFTSQNKYSFERDS